MVVLLSDSKCSKCLSVESLFLFLAFHQTILTNKLIYLVWLLKYLLYL
jgi:hypothetical protein